MGVEKTYFCDWCDKELTRREFLFSTSKTIFRKFGSHWINENIICPSCKEKLNNLIDEIRGVKKNTNMEYAKVIVQDLLDNSDEYARQRAIDWLEEIEQC